MKINTVLFDLDGTLVDSELVIMKSFKYVFDKYFPEYGYGVDECRRFIGPTLYQTFSNYTKNEDIIKLMIEGYMHYYKSIEFSIIKLFPTVKETLKYLSDNHYNVCLVTSKFTTSAMPSLTHLNISQYFTGLLCLEKQAKPKPDKDPIIRAVSLFNNASLGKTIMIGDMPEDVKAAKNAGVLSACVTWSPKVEEIKQLEPDYILTKISDLIEILKKINEEEEKGE